MPFCSKKKVECVLRLAGNTVFVVSEAVINVAFLKVNTYTYLSPEAVFTLSRAVLVCQLGSQ
jgi:hypothetical protein